MKAHILITRAIFPETIAFLKQHFVVADNQDGRPFDEQTLAAKLADKEGVLLFSNDRLDAAVMARAPRLKASCNVAVGYNNVDLAAATERKIMVTNTPEVLTDSTADTTFALILAAARRVTELEAWLRAGNWDSVRFTEMLGRDVHHATLGIIGMGRIGRAVAKRARGFDMRVLYSDTVRLSPHLEQECDARYVSKEELLGQSDFVTLHVFYAPETHHMIGSKELALMKPTAVLINAARGGVVDELALVDALKNGRLYAAGLDVFENEPAVRPELLALKNVVLLPHIGSQTETTRRAMAQLAADNLVAALQGREPPNWLNRWS
jgi:glyoxylate/hydroxypyruvate/2-ketogluconate reductase